MMPLNNTIKPENILSDTENSTIINGVMVRKGSIAAFLKNIDLLEENPIDQQQKEILKTMKELAPALVAAGLFKHAIFKNATVQKILEENAANTGNK